MKPTKAIIEDLLPLYHEGLLSEETTKWLEEEANQNKDYQRLLSLSERQLTDEQKKSSQRSIRKKCLSKFIVSFRCIK